MASYLPAPYITFLNIFEVLRIFLGCTVLASSLLALQFIHLSRLISSAYQSHL